MVRRWMQGVGVALLALAGGCAGPSEAKRDVEAAIPGLEESAEGMIVSVEDDSIEVRPADDPGAPPIRFQRTPETDLVRDDEPFSWPELAEGMPVRVHFEARGGAEQATRIEILTGSEAESIRRRTGGSTGWSRPEGVGTRSPEEEPPPMGVGEPKDEMDASDPATDEPTEGVR